MTRCSGRALDAFVGCIAAGGFASGEQVVTGIWRASPFQRLIDVMWIRPSGERVLLAPSAAARDYIASVYAFDRADVVPVHGGWDGTQVVVSAGPLQIQLVPRRRDWRSWVFASRPRRLRRSPLWISVVEDRFVERLAGPLIGGGAGVHLSGVTPSGRREWYGVDDYRQVDGGSLTVAGVGAGPLTSMRPDIGVGVSAFPIRPAIVHVCTLLEPPRA